MKKNIVLCSVAIVLVVMILASCGAKDINLSDMKNGQEYTYLGIPWMSSAEEVEKALGYPLGEPRIAEEKTGIVHLYKPEQEVSILGKKATAIEFQFRNEGLVNVLIVFDGEEFTSFYDQLLEECKKTFGEDDLVESSKTVERFQRTYDMPKWSFTKEVDGKEVTTSAGISRSTDTEGKQQDLAFSVGCFTPLENMEE